jgi:hypothetical protein
VGYGFTCHSVESDMNDPTRQRERAHRDRKRGKAKSHDAPPLSPELDAYSVPTFCRRHGGMSIAFFYKLQAAKLGPAVMKVGARTFVSAEAAAAWRRAREAASQTAA